MVESDAEKLCAALRKAGGGSFLRGWRRELDPDGSLDVGFLEFCQAAKRLGVAVDAPALFGEDSPDSLELIELAPKQGQLVEDFRQWMTDALGGPGDMFVAWEANDGRQDGKLTKQAFINGVHEHGFDATDEDIAEIFNLLDSMNLGFVVMEDVMFLETDPKRREGAINKAKDKVRREHEELLTNFFKEHSNSTLPLAHRLAPRFWHAPTFDHLPKVAIQKRLVRNQQRDQAKISARAMFMKHVKTVYGNGVRMWRRALDPHCKFGITKRDLGSYIRRVNLNIDLDALWNAIDMDGDETICMEEISQGHAAALAEFRHWARTEHGSCVASWERLRAVAPSHNRWKSPTSMLYATFVSALRAAKWPGLGEGFGSKLCSGLDCAGCGIVSKSDMEWLDKWEAPEWLCMEPDQDAWCELAAKLLEVHGQPLRAWRAMDEDDSNIVSWSEFKEAAAAVGFEGNVAGAWRVLDDNVSGTITLQEFDGPSSELLLSFKNWLDSNFGSVEFAFKQIDTDGSGSLTCSELRRACKRLHWEGDVRTLFECLNVEVVPGKRSLSSKDLAFLDTWKPNPDVWEDEVQDLSATGIIDVQGREGSKKHSGSPGSRPPERPRSASVSELLPLTTRPPSQGAVAPKSYDFPSAPSHMPSSSSQKAMRIHQTYGVQPGSIALAPKQLTRSACTLPPSHPSRPPMSNVPTTEDKVAHMRKEMELLRASATKLHHERRKFRERAQRACQPSKPGRRKRAEAAGDASEERAEAKAAPDERAAAAAAPEGPAEAFELID